MRIGSPVRHLVPATNRAVSEQPGGRRIRIGFILLTVTAARRQIEVVNPAIGHYIRGMKAGQAKYRTSAGHLDAIVPDWTRHEPVQARPHAASAQCRTRHQQVTLASAHGAHGCPS
jgi:hypothetical protein